MRGPDGKVLGKGVVHLYPVEYGKGGNKGGKADLDSSGRFRLAGLPPGEYRTSILSLGKKQFSAPGGAVVVVAGDERRLEIRLPDTKISGRVTRKDTGAPLGRDDVQISAYGPDGALGMTWADDEGRFEFLGLSPGEWGIVVYPLRVPGLRPVRREVTLPPSGRLEGVEMALPPR